MTGLETKSKISRGLQDISSMAGGKFNLQHAWVGGTKE